MAHTHTHPLWLHPLSWQEGTTMWGSTRQTYPVSSAPFVGRGGTRRHRSSGAALPEDDHVPLPAHLSLLTTSTHTSGLLPTPCSCEAFFTIKMMLWKSGSCLVRDQPALLQKVATRKRLHNCQFLGQQPTAQQPAGDNIHEIYHRALESKTVTKELQKQQLSSK